MRVSTEIDDLPKGAPPEHINSNGRAQQAIEWFRRTFKSFTKSGDEGVEQMMDPEREIMKAVVCRHFAEYFTEDKTEKEEANKHLQELVASFNSLNQPLLVLLEGDQLNFPKYEECPMTTTTVDWTFPTQDDFQTIVGAPQEGDEARRNLMRRLLGENMIQGDDLANTKTMPTGHDSMEDLSVSNLMWILGSEVMQDGFRANLDHSGYSASSPRIRNMPNKITIVYAHLPEGANPEGQPVKVISISPKHD